jgi:hypothetical protein
MKLETAMAMHLVTDFTICYVDEAKAGMLHGPFLANYMDSKIVQHVMRPDRNYDRKPICIIRNRLVEH